MTVLFNLTVLINRIVDRLAMIDPIRGCRALALGCSSLWFLLAGMGLAAAPTRELPTFGQIHAGTGPSIVNLSALVCSNPAQEAPVTDDDASSQQSESSRNTTSGSDATAPREAEPNVAPSETTGPPTPVPVAPTTESSEAVPLESRQRVVRTIRFAVVVAATLLAMLSTVVLLKVNRWTHGKYMGRLWWAGVLLVSGWLLAGWLWAWNNDAWATWLDGPLL